MWQGIGEVTQTVEILALKSCPAMWESQEGLDFPSFGSFEATNFDVGFESDTCWDPDCKSSHVPEQF